MDTPQDVSKDWSLQCGRCSEVFTDMAILNVHEKEHVVLTPFRCMLCPDEKKSIFSSLALCKQHFSEHGEGCIKLYGCGLCPESHRTYVDDISLFRHLNLHHTLGRKIFRCSECPEPFADLRLYLRHMFKEHSILEKDNAYICGVCTAEYDNLVSFTEHQLARHGKFVGQEPFKCRRCHKAFWDTYSRTRHEYTHSHDAPFVCKGCNRRFPEENNLRVHLKSASGLACRALMPEKTPISKPSNNPGSLQILLHGAALPHSLASEGVLLCELCGHEGNEESFEKHSHVLLLPRSPQGTNTVFTPDELKRMVHADPNILQNTITLQPDSSSSPLCQLAEIALTSTQIPELLNDVPAIAPTEVLNAPSTTGSGKDLKNKKKGTQKSKLVSPVYSDTISDEDKEILKQQTVSDSDLNEKVPSPPPYSILQLLDIYPVRRFTPHLKTKLVMLLSKYAITYVHRIVSICAICTSVFDDVQEYKRHALKHKGGSRDMKVPPENLITGIFKEDDETTQHACGIVCLHCLQPFVNFYDFYQHVKKTSDGWASGCIHGLQTYSMDPCLETLKSLQSSSKQPKANASGAPTAADATVAAATTVATPPTSAQPQSSAPTPPVGNMVTIKHNLQKIQNHLSKMKSSHGTPSPPAANVVDNSTLLRMLQSQPLSTANVPSMPVNSGQNVPVCKKAIRRFKSNKIKASEISQATVDAARGKLPVDNTKVQAKNGRSVSDKPISPKPSIASMLQIDTGAKTQQMINLEDNIVRSCLTPSHENTKSQPKKSLESKTCQSPKGFLQDVTSEVFTISLATDTSTSPLSFDKSADKLNAEMKSAETNHDRQVGPEMVNEETCSSTKKVTDTSVQLPPQQSDSLDERTAFALELTSVKVTAQQTESLPKPSADALSEVPIEPVGDVLGVMSISCDPKETVQKDFTESTVSDQTVQHQESPGVSADSSIGVSKRTRKKPKRFIDMEDPTPKKRGVDNCDKTKQSNDDSKKVGNNRLDHSSASNVEQKSNKKKRKVKKHAAQKPAIPCEVVFNDLHDDVKDVIGESSDYRSSPPVCSDSDATVEFCSQENADFSGPEEHVDGSVISTVDFNDSQRNAAADSSTGMNGTEKTVQEGFCCKGSNTVENEALGSADEKVCGMIEEGTETEVTGQNTEKLPALSPVSGQDLTLEQGVNEEPQIKPSVFENGFDEKRECNEVPALVGESNLEGNIKTILGKKRKSKRKFGPWSKTAKIEEIPKEHDQNAGVSSSRGDNLVSDDLISGEPLLNKNDDERDEMTSVEKRPVEEIALEGDDMIGACRPLEDKLKTETPVTSINAHSFQGDCSLLDKGIAFVKLQRLNLSCDAALRHEPVVETANVEAGLYEEPVLEESVECCEEPDDTTSYVSRGKQNDSLSMSDRTSHLSVEGTEDGVVFIDETVPLLSNNAVEDLDVKDGSLSGTHMQHCPKDVDASSNTTAQGMEVTACGEELELNEEPSTVVSNVDADMEYPSSTSEMLNKKVNVSSEYSENEDIALLSSTSASSEDELKFYKASCEMLEKELVSLKRAVGKTLVNGSDVSSNYLNGSEEDEIVGDVMNPNSAKKRGKMIKLIEKQVDDEKYCKLEAQNASLMQKNAEIEKNIADLDEKLRTSQEEEKKVLEKCASLEKTNERLLQKAYALETLLKSSCESHLQKLQLVKSRVNDFEKRNATLQVKYKEMEEKMDQCLLVASGARRDRNEMNEKIVSLKRVHDAVVSEKESAHASSVKQKKELLDLRTDVLKLIQMLDSDLVQDVGEHLERVDEKLKTVILHLKE